MTSNPQFPGSRGGRGGKKAKRETWPAQRTMGLVGGTVGPLGRRQMMRALPFPEERFTNFDRAYIGARYDVKYRICEADLRYFAERVELLMSETESRCRAFLVSLPESSPADD